MNRLWNKEQGGSKETIQLATALVQVRDGGGLDIKEGRKEGKEEQQQKQTEQKKQ